MDEMTKAQQIAISGMKAQSERLRVVSENLSNADSLPTSPDQDPYRRKTIAFRNVLDKALGANVVKVDKVDVDRSAFQKKYEPGHPAADSNGYVLAPNVNPLIELMDMREAQRSYEANLDVMEAARSLKTSTINTIR
jgi:flagellar basal-body rod protein FlgC